jgi:two-component system phosphate regulon sensor histidine kinase PhoR
VFDVAATTDDAPLGVPGLRAVVDPTARELESVWLRPLLLAGLALGLGVAIAVAVRLQLRAAQREVALARTQSEFLTTVTHELKTPLAGIRLLGEMLAEGRARGREQDYYRMLAGEAERLSQLIQNVLDLGRIERGERAYDLRSHDVGELVATTLAWFAPLVRQDGLVVASTVSGLCRARIDRDAFVQALVAVLDNARKYGASGGRLDVVVVGGEANVRVAVRDHGPGVPESEHESVFAKFVRGQAHRHGSTPGVGIGLYLARTIVRRLGGELAVASASETAELFPVASGGAAAGNAAIAAAASQGDDASMRTDDAPGTARPAVADSGPGACFVFRLPVETSA